jgi:type IX secretion system PorP/SprF family membrane protein
MAQDIHLSQFWMSPASINPASAGFVEGNARFGTYVRTQWTAITKAYQTCGASVDLPIAKRPRFQDIFGFGMTVDYDRAGDAKLSACIGNVLFSYAHSLNSHNNHFLMAGVSLGFQQRTWNYSVLSFDQQYRDGVYLASNDVNEKFAGTKHWFADIGAGIAWFYSFAQEAALQAGISAYHINRPSVTLIEAQNVRLRLRWVTNITAVINIREKTSLYPLIYYAHQGQYNEWMFGLNYSFNFPVDAKGSINKFTFGLHHRWKDAVYFSTGFELRGFAAAVSYDFNVSRLTKVSRARGGVEVALSYTFRKTRAIRQKSIPCYLF